MGGFEVISDFMRDTVDLIENQPGYDVGWFKQKVEEINEERSLYYLYY